MIALTAASRLFQKTIAGLQTVRCKLDATASEASAILMGRIGPCPGASVAHQID